jgi:hypothetical protein
MMRRLLLQETQGLARRIERGRRVRRSGGSSRFFDLEEGSHRVGDGLGNAHQSIGYLGIGLNRPQRSGKCLASGFRSRDRIGHEPSRDRLA